ncbi:aldo/keto reductase [Marinivivus vitaminiproducens]|uniref:aldo/keto reductase n=1 Tax=Marinivivus vitaminiproducens TaxID=3035935 RepID=UPI0027A6F11A|nr:aldo/keto reductase [Geminicoccaceae bacterium SCSIO 64248]
MKYAKLGRSGLEVSRICLGCMSFGEPSRGRPTWSLPEEESRVIIRHAIERGITFFDTANIYSDGSSEEITGRALRDLARREEIVLATKVNSRMHDGPNGAGLSRKAILHEIDMSLRRLGTDYVDLYQIHRFDRTTPIEETLEALHDVVRMGKARYIGASSMFAWQFARMLHTSDRHGWTRFISMQDQYNLLNREEEREMMPLCEAEGIGTLPWSPLAKGRLARRDDRSSERSRTDSVAESMYGDSETLDRPVIDAVHALADGRGVPPAQIALAWILGRSPVTAPIVGASKTRHVDDAIAAVDLDLSEDEARQMEAPYRPHRVVGFT